MIRTRRVFSGVSIFGRRGRLLPFWGQFAHELGVPGSDSFDDAIAEFTRQIAQLLNFGIAGDSGGFINPPASLSAKLLQRSNDAPVVIESELE